MESNSPKVPININYKLAFDSSLANLFPWKVCFQYVCQKTVEVLYNNREIEKWNELGKQYKVHFQNAYKCWKSSVCSRKYQTNISKHQNALSCCDNRRKYVKLRGQLEAILLHKLIVPK